MDAGVVAARRRATKSRRKREDFTGSLHAFPRGSRQIRDLRENNLPFVASRASVPGLLMPPFDDLKLHVRAKRVYAPDNPIAGPLSTIGSTPTVLRAKLYRNYASPCLAFSPCPRSPSSRPLLIASHPPGVNVQRFSMVIPLLPRI